LHLSRLEPLEALYLFAPLDLLSFFALPPALARSTAAICIVCWPTYALDSTWEGRDVRCVGLFVAEVVRALEALGYLIKLVIFKEVVGVGTGWCCCRIRISDGRGSCGDLIVGR
jgi:hypothetical protein